MNWKDILKTQRRPDYPDLDGDGDTEEPMATALQTVEQVNSVKKTPEKTHYTKDGKVWNGPTHKMPNGKLMSGNPHNEDSEELFHADEV